MNTLGRHVSVIIVEATILCAVSLVGIHPHRLGSGQDVSVLDLHQDLFGCRIERSESLEPWGNRGFLVILGGFVFYLCLFLVAFFSFGFVLAFTLTFVTLATLQVFFDIDKFLGSC